MEVICCLFRIAFFTWPSSMLKESVKQLSRQNVRLWNWKPILRVFIDVAVVVFQTLLSCSSLYIDLCSRKESVKDLLCFYKTLAAFYTCSLKQLFWNLRTYSIKMSVMACFSSVVGRVSFIITETGHYHGHFPSMFPQISKSICKSCFLFLSPSKFQKNNTKICKIKSKIWEHICMSCSLKNKPFRR